MHELDKIVIEHLQEKYQKAYTGYMMSLAVGFTIAGIGIVQTIAACQQNEGVLALSERVANFVDNTFSIAMKNPVKDFALPGCTLAFSTLSLFGIMPFLERCWELKEKIKDFTQQYTKTYSEETQKEFENDGYLSEEQLNDLPRYVPLDKEDWSSLSKKQRVLYKYLYMDSKQAVDAYRERFGLGENKRSAELPVP